MRISVARYAFVALMIFGLSGCKSGSSWSMPNLAFWKSNPFKSSDTPSNPGIPKPSQIAGASSTWTTPAPAAAYTGTASTTAPPVTGYPGAGAYNAPYTGTQQLYPSTQPAPPASYGLGTGSTPYVASQPGFYGPGSAAAAGDLESQAQGGKSIQIRAGKIQLAQFVQIKSPAGPLSAIGIS